MRKRNISPERLIEAIKEYIDRKGSFDTIPLSQASAISMVGLSRFSAKSDNIECQLIFYRGLPVVPG